MKTPQVAAIPGMTPLGITPIDNQRHGGPWDRGSADSYYHRPSVPHYYVHDTGTSQRVGREDMTVEEIAAYEQGYQWNEDFGDKKNWD